MQQYCQGDAAITMQIIKNRTGNLQIGNILFATGPSQVDGEPWWKLDLSYPASKWLRALNDPRVVEIKGADGLFDVPEDIYILTKLKWA
jgi:hypothetical protein